MSDLLGGGAPTAPSFDPGPLNQGLAASESAMANRYDQLGLGGSTMQQQDAAALGADFSTQQGIEANNFAQQNFQNQLALNNLQNSSGGGLAGIASLAGFLGA